MLAGLAVEKKEVAVAAGLCDQLPLLSPELAVKQDWRLHRVPVVNIVRRRLKIPDKLPRVSVQRHNRAGIKVVTFAPLSREHWIRIPRAPINQVEIRIVSSGHP